MAKDTTPPKVDLIPTGEYGSWEYATKEGLTKRRINAYKLLAAELVPAIKELKSQMDNAGSTEEELDLRKQISDKVQELKRSNEDIWLDSKGSGIQNSQIKAWAGEYAYGDDLFSSADIDKSFVAGSPEYITAVGEIKAQGKLDTKLEQANTESKELLDQGLDRLDQGREDTLAALAEGRKDTLAAINAGKEEATTEITAGEGKLSDIAKEGATGIEDAAVAGGEKIADAGAATGTQLSELGKATGEELRLAALEGGQGITDAAKAGGDAISTLATEGAGKMSDAYKEGLNQATTRLDPYAASGEKALGAYEQAIGLGDTPFDQSQLSNLPGFQFRLDQGIRAAQSGAAARGGALGGRALKELQYQGEGLAAQEYGRYLSNLGGLVDKGQNAATNLAGMGMQAASGIAGAEQFGAAGGMAGAELASRGAMQGAQFAAVGAQRGAEYAGNMQAAGIQFAGASEQQGIQLSTLGQQDAARFQAAGEGQAAQFGAAGRAAIAQGATAQQVAAIGQESISRARTEQVTANAAASIYGIQANTTANLYGTQATAGANIVMQTAQTQAASEWQRMEIEFAREMAQYQGGNTLFGSSFLADALTVASFGFQAYGATKSPKKT